jgi:nitroreductase
MQFMAFVRSIVQQLKSIRILAWLEDCASTSNLLANLYYLARPKFSREHRAVLYGRALHRRQVRQRLDSDAARHTLRRSIHRIEKGLIMRPRREVFAKDYIGETVDLFDALTAADHLCEDADLLSSWATDVLSDYFSAVGNSPVIDPLRERFQRLVSERGLTVSNCRPYLRELTPLRITYEDLLQLARRRRSCRWYLPKLVPREIIDRAVIVAGQSPSACNRQPFEFRIFDEPKLAQRIGAIPLGTGGFSQNFPCVAVLIGKLRAFPFERDRHIPYIDGSLAAMAFQFALEVQGVGSCCINFPDIPGPEKAMVAALKLQPDERPVMLISFGYPDAEGLVPFSQKKSLDELRSFNRIC